MKKNLIIVILTALTMSFFFPTSVIAQIRGVADVQSCFSVEDGKTGQLMCEIMSPKQIDARINVTSLISNSECVSKVPFAFNATYDTYIGASVFRLPAGLYTVSLKIKNFFFFYKIKETREVEIKQGEFCPLKFSL